jgi:hypothetical protein
MIFEVTDNTMNPYLLSFNHALRIYFNFTKIWANRVIVLFKKISGKMSVIYPKKYDITLNFI